ncbi:ras-related and estrogen-regulated growth inhibitor [Plakobranchus ocellatus]|uniref:small monomeric GTPase n=1 Tax=Plakobranchus ocellatus TaxID=259542 RepID=A0AAV3Z5X0_9GAST|nr:ras-related and estrogen-regulated growth inhibitor [Plakobranchus ocellatus]
MQTFSDVENGVLSLSGLEEEVVVLGPGAWAFTVRFITKRYIGDYAPNVEMLYTHKMIGSRDEINLEILDTASDMSAETLEKHIKWADGYLLIYSVTDRDSYQAACSFKDQLFQLRGSDLPVVLVSNKHDLLTARAVTEDEGANLEGELDCPRFQISVAEGQEGVTQVMDELLVLIKRELVKSLTAPSPTQDSVAGLEKKSRLYNMKKAFKKRIVRSRSDTF